MAIRVVVGLSCFGYTVFGVGLGDNVVALRHDVGNDRSTHAFHQGVRWSKQLVVDLLLSLISVETRYLPDGVFCQEFEYVQATRENLLSEFYVLFDRHIGSLRVKVGRYAGQLCTIVYFGVDAEKT